MNFLKKVQYQIFFLSVFTQLNAQVYTDVTNSLNIASVQTLSDSFGSGASIADYDNDGDLDFFIGTEFGLNNRLYQNDGSGQFVEIAASVGITSTYRNRAALWVDYNGDQLLDLVLLGDCRGVDNACTDRVVIFLYKQIANGNFEEVTTTGLDFGQKYSLPNVSDIIVSGGLAAADINNDNWLDILVTVWDTRSQGSKMVMFLNNTGTSFTDISSTSFPSQNSVSRYQPIFHDFDDDGFMDFYVSIDFTANEFWRNLGNNQFEEIGSTIGVANPFNEMGLTLGDYDNDGDFDMYATNISRIDPTEGNQRHNILLRNDWSQTGTLGFTEISQTLNVDDSGWDWGTTFFESNNDGWIDLATTNGYDLENWQPDQSKIWLNTNGIIFSDISSTANFNDMEYAASLLAFDMERDGDLDLLQTIKISATDSKPVRLYKNNISETLSNNNYIVVKPRMNGSNHFAIGTVVRITYDGDKKGTRLITAGTSFYGQEPAEAFFGLAGNTIIDEIEIEWPDNTTTILNDVSVNQVLEVTNDNVLSIENTEAEVIKIFPNPTKDNFTISAQFNLINVEIFNVLGQKVFQKELNNEVEDINISELSSGNYFVKIKNAATLEVSTIRIIKQ